MNFPQDDTGSSEQQQDEQNQDGTTPAPEPKGGSEFQRATVEDNGQQKPTERPEGLPEGFDSWEEFGKAQLANKQEGTEEGSTSEGDEGDTADELSPEQRAEVDEALKDVPEVNREKATPFFEEFARTGSLSEESVKGAAEAFGVTEDMVRTYMDGWNARNSAALDNLFTEAGTTEAEYREFMEWANGAMSPEQLSDFNTKLQGDKPAEAIKAGITQWKESGNGPTSRDITKNLPNNSSASGAEVEGYASLEEQTRDINDPRFAKDPAFRAQVEKKIMASTFGNARDVT